jgi:nitrite reductase/ring-hydroxylating ferredoxin subunit
MDLPASVVAHREQLRGAEEFSPDPALLSDADVFAAERTRIFVQPLLAVDHATRLSEDGHYFRCDAAPRSLILTREDGGRLHALRNVCIHAGYPVCEAEEGPAERLVCLYHGWEYTLDGRLVEPALSSRIDPSRLRLAEYPVQIRNGLILVDLSGKADTVEQSLDAPPAWLETARVTGRIRHSTTRNWKVLHRFLRSSPQLFFRDTPDFCFEFGPLSLLMVQSQRAVLLRVIPRFVEQTDLELIEMVKADAPEPVRPATVSDVIEEGLRRAGDLARWFDRPFADWYWSLMSAA